MSETSWVLEKGLTGGQWAWPEEGSVALVLDGIAIAKLPLQIYQWGQGPAEAQCLYAGTRWEPVKACSPWLVHLAGPDDPILQGYLKNEASRESGFLIVHTGLRDEMANTLRALLQVERVPGVPELLRIGHPFIARHVIGERLMRQPSEHGVSTLLVPDRARGQWSCIQRSGEASDTLASLGPVAVVVDNELLEAFSQFEQRRAVLSILDNPGGLMLNWLGSGSFPDRYDRLCAAFKLAAEWSLDTPRARSLFIELLQVAQVRPWLGDRLPEGVTESLAGSEKSVPRVSAALQSISKTPSPESNVQG